MGKIREASSRYYLWWLADDPGLSAKARKGMADPASIIYVSAASVWEISIKTQLGKLDMDGDPVEEIWSNGFVELPMTARQPSPWVFPA